MKKLNLKLEGIGEMLTKEQMRKVLGGYGGYGEYGGYGGYGGGSPCDHITTFNVCYNCGMMNNTNPEWEIIENLVYDHCARNYPY